MFPVAALSHGWVQGAGAAGALEHRTCHQQLWDLLQEGVRDTWVCCMLHRARRSWLFRLGHADDVKTPHPTASPGTLPPLQIKWLLRMVAKLWVAQPSLPAEPCPHGVALPGWGHPIVGDILVGAKLAGICSCCGPISWVYLFFLTCCVHSRS